MNNAELIKALQCTSHFALYQDCYERNCYANSGKGLYCNIPKLMADAADAIERLQAENNALRSENETYHKLVLLSIGEINELRYKLHLDEMEIDGPFSIEDLKIPSGNGFELRADGVSKLQAENDESNREEKPNDTIRPN